MSFVRSSEFRPFWFFSKDELVRQRSWCRPFSWPCPCTQERFFSLMITTCWSEWSTVLWDGTPSDCCLGKILVWKNMLLQGWSLNLPSCLSMTMKAQQQEVTGGVEGASGLVVYFELDSWPRLKPFSQNHFYCTVNSYKTCRWLSAPYETCMNSGNIH